MHTLFNLGGVRVGDGGDTILYLRRKREVRNNPPQFNRYRLDPHGAKRGVRPTLASQQTTHARLSVEAAVDYTLKRNSTTSPSTMT